MKWLIDIDGVIASNPSFWSWWTYTLTKKGNDNQVSILTARNPSRLKETERQLEKWDIHYDALFIRPEWVDKSFKGQGEWKLKKALEILPDIWIDDHFKIYERECGISLDGARQYMTLLQI